MNIIRSLLASALLASPCVADVVLSKELMELTKLSAELSSLAYAESPPGDQYDHFGFFDAEPDQALVVKQDGYCFGAFRGTTLTFDDWSQNFDLGFEEICDTQADESKTCCSTREGFYKAYYTDYQEEMETAIRECAADCQNADECVVFTGHSQGGAIAAVAGLVMADLNPYVITFGQPATIDAPCEMVTSERWYRFVNTKASIDKIGITYDPIPFAPGVGADSFGHMIILGEDPTGVAYIGLDAQDKFGPLNTAGFESHSMVHGEGVEYPGYLDRINTLLNNTDAFPIRANGFAAGTLCSEGSECMSGVCDAETGLTWNRCVGEECKEDDECESGRCDSGICIPKLSSCMACDEDTDCAGGKCLLFKCSGPEGLMDDNCNCKWDSDCRSERCELFETGFCEAKLAIGGSCNEGTDCQSGYCSWSFVCEDAEIGKERAIKAKKGGLGALGVIVILAVIGGIGYCIYTRRQNDYDEIVQEVVV